MAGIWTITYDDGTGAVEKSAADWGLNARPIIRTRDRSETVISFSMANADPAGGIPFPFKSKVIIKQNRIYAAGAWSGSGYVFTGYQTTQKGRVDGQRQGVMLDFADAIWLLKNTTFQQIWNVNASDGMGGVTTTGIPISRIVLFMDANSWTSYPWQSQSIQWQINEVLTYAASCGISIAAGTIDYGSFYLNYYQVRAVSCWDAILKCLEPVPDAKVWVDGSTATPTLQVRTRANLAALTAPTTTAPGPITLPWRATDSKGRRHFSTQLTPRHDLVPPQIVIQYQINNTLNGKSSPTWTNDVYPAGSDGKTPFAMVVPIDLAGASFTTESGQMDSEPLACVGGTQAQKRAWWASKRGGEQSQLADFRVRFQDLTGAATTIGDATVTDDSGATIDLGAYPNRLVKGTYHAWMNGINVIRAHVRVTVQYCEYDVEGTTPAETDTNGNVRRKFLTKELHAHIVLTNSASGVQNYSGVSVSGIAESPITGLAQNIYNSRKDLDYDGEHEIVDPGNATNIPLSQIIGHWNVINFSGGDAAWATANMTVAGSEIDLMTNHQRIEIGPSRHLSPQDWNEMLQFFRNRRILLPSEIRATGYGDQSSNIDMARNTPDGNTVDGLDVEAVSSLISPDSVDGTRTNVIKQDATGAQLQVVQQKTSDNTIYTTGIIAPEYSGAGAPGTSTLAASAYYRVGNRYFDTAAKVQYRCSTEGDKSSSIWDEVSGGSGGFSFKGKYDKTASYAAGDLVLVEPWDAICTSGAYDIEQSINHSALTVAHSMPGFYVCLNAAAPGTYSGTPAYYVPQQPPVQTTHTNGDPYVYNDAKAYWLLIQPYPEQQYVIHTLSNADYYVANTWDGTYIGTQDVYIAKDPRQRPSVSSEVIDSTTISYSSYTSDNTRSASDGTNSEYQVVFPRFVTHGKSPGGIGPANLSVVSAYVPWLGTDVSVSGQPIYLQELKPARVWARRFTQ